MKPLALTSAILLLAISTQAHSQVAADTAAGRKRAAVCLACHGADGNAIVPGVPHLAGQDRSYLEKALRAYRDGTTRQDPTMTAMAKPLSDKDVVNIAAYFAGQKRKGQ